MRTEPDTLPLQKCHRNPPSPPSFSFSFSLLILILVLVLENCPLSPPSPDQQSSLNRTDNDLSPFFHPPHKPKFNHIG